jgi:WD40 repeat protein
MRSMKSILSSMLMAIAALGILASRGSAQESGGITTDRARADGPMEPDEPHWTAPVNLGAIVNSFSDETQGVITHSRLSLYFSSDRPGGFGSQDIWVSQRTSVDAPWGEPQNLGSSINSAAQEFSPSFSPDDRCMFFPSGRPGGFGRQDIYMTCRLNATDDFGWQTPVNLGPSINTSSLESDPFYFVDPNSGEATLYFTTGRAGVSNPRVPGGFLLDIYQSTQKADGSFAPAVLNKELSSPYDDRHMSIRSDGLLLIFTSDRPGGVGGLDLWASTRRDTHEPWGEPVNLGPPVNSEADERGAALTNDDVTLLFSSDRAGGFGQGDLWMTTFKRRHRNSGPQTPERN